MEDFVQLLNEKIDSLLFNTYYIMKTNFKRLSIIALFAAITFLYSLSVCSQPLWDSAKKNRDVLTISTLFIAQDVRDFLSTPSGLDNAVNWCKQTGITRVFIESFRGAYYADKDAMVHARDRFLKEGFDVAGCVTTVGVGKPGSGGWGMTSCYTSKATLEEMEKILNYCFSL